MDLNGDGFGDILSGSYSRNEQPMAGLFQVLWGQKGGAFKKAAVLNGADGKPLVIPYKGQSEVTEGICTRPFAVDWNGDGRLDLVVGTFSGSFYLFTGEGGGKFKPKPDPILAGRSPLKMQGAHSDPFIVDWDGDGDLDLLSGSSQGGVQWAENTAGKGKAPELKPFRELIKPSADATHSMIRLRAESDLTGPSSCTRIWVDDVNGDGKPDILAGDCVTLISPAKGVSREEFARRSATWQAEYDEAMKAMHGTPSEAAKKKWQQVYERRGEFMIEDQTGFVWLYLRK